MSFLSPFIEEKSELLAFIEGDVHLVHEELAEFDIKDLHYRFIKSAFTSNGFGLTLKRHGAGQFAILLRDPSHPGCYRIQEFDKRGFFGHQTVNSIAELLYLVVTSRYWYPVNRDTVDSLMSSEEWHRGSEVTNLIQKLNAGQISFNEYCAKLKESDYD